MALRFVTDSRAAPVKPSDHPDFYRLPPPPGRSRESGIVLDREGRFWNGSDLLARPAMATAFASWIATHPDDGRFILTNGYDWTYFRVDDVPFFVRAVKVEGARVLLDLSDGTEEPLDPATVSVGAGDALYARVKAGRFEARFFPAAQLSLEPVVVEDERGAPCLDIGGSRHAVGPRRDGSPEKSKGF